MRFEILQNRSEEFAPRLGIAANLWEPTPPLCLPFLKRMAYSRLTRKTQQIKTPPAVYHTFNVMQFTFYFPMPLGRLHNSISEQPH